MTKKLIRFGSAVMITLLALVVLWQFRMVVLYVLISLALAAALRPLANRLVGRGFVLRIVWISIFIVAIGCLGYFLFLTAETAIIEIQQLTQSVSVQDEWRLPIWLKGSSLQQVMVEWLPSPSILFEAITGDQGQRVLPAIFGFTQNVGMVLSSVLIILFLSIYWRINQNHFERLWFSLLPSGQRRQVRSIFRKIEDVIGAYIRSELIQSLLAGVLLGLGYWLLGSPYPVLLAMIGALACLIPVVGVALVIIPVILVGLLTSLQLSLITAIYTLVVMIVLGVWVNPWLINRRWDNPILTVVLIIAFADAFGLFGIIIAPPVSVVCQILWSSIVSHRAVLKVTDRISDIKKRQERVLGTIKAMDESSIPQVVGSMERLTRLIEKAEPILQAGLPNSAKPAKLDKAFQSPENVTADEKQSVPIKPKRNRR